MSKIITSKKLGVFPEIRIAVSTKSFGNQSLQHPLISEKETILNRSRFFDALDIDSNAVINAELCHGKKIYWVANQNQNSKSPENKSIVGKFDGLATSQHGVYLMVTMADCFPIFMYDPKIGCIALLHAGWRGIVKNIAVNGIKTLQKRAGSTPSDLVIFVGPGIHCCHFKVDNDLAEQFVKMFGPNAVAVNGRQKSVNLVSAIKSQLISAGVKENNIEISEFCTYCEKTKFSSYRRDGENYIAQGAIIGMI
ncbi:MAG: peptidoglycan editing factor PgeF [Patescibacteria group bacterium]